jgi:glycosyltransferase involved in cell wall biosynthesis
MKVLILNALYHPNVTGGAERSVQLLAESLVHQGVEVVVASTVARGKARTDHINGVRVVYVPMVNVHWPYDGVARSGLQRKLWHVLDAYNPLMRAAVAALIRQETPTVVHTNNLQGFSVSAWSAARTARLPVLHTLRDYYLSCARASRYHGGRNCVQTCLECRPFGTTRRLASAQVAGVAGISRFILEVHRGLGFFSQARVWQMIPHASWMTAAASLPRPASPVVTFGYLGRLEAMKGLDVLLDSFGARTDAGWRLLVAGEGSAAYLDHLRARHAALPARDAIHFSGWTDPDTFLRSIDVLVLPSLWHDPLPRVILEAAAHGVPTIASRRGGIPELIDDGVNGLLFEPDDPRALPAAVDGLLTDRARLDGLRMATLQHAGRRTDEHVATDYLYAYRVLLAPATASAAPVTSALG